MYTHNITSTSTNHNTHCSTHIHTAVHFDLHQLRHLRCWGHASWLIPSIKIIFSTPRPVMTMIVYVASFTVTMFTLFMSVRHGPGLFVTQPRAQLCCISVWLWVNHSPCQCTALSDSKLGISGCLRQSELAPCVDVPHQAIIVFKSESVLDVMKDAVAVAYVSEIDNYSFQLLAKLIPPVSVEQPVIARCRVRPCPHCHGTHHSWAGGGTKTVPCAVV